MIEAREEVQKEMNAINNEMDFHAENVTTNSDRLIGRKKLISDWQRELLPEGCDFAATLNGVAMEVTKVQELVNTPVTKREFVRRLNIFYVLTGD